MHVASWSRRRATCAHACIDMHACAPAIARACRRSTCASGGCMLCFECIAIRIRFQAHDITQAHPNIFQINSQATTSSAFGACFDKKLYIVLEKNKQAPESYCAAETRTPRASSLHPTHSLDDKLIFGYVSSTISWVLVSCLAPQHYHNFKPDVCAVFCHDLVTTSGTAQLK